MLNRVPRFFGLLFIVVSKRARTEKKSKGTPSSPTPSVVLTISTMNFYSSDFARGYPLANVTLKFILLQILLESFNFLKVGPYGDRIISKRILLLKRFANIPSDRPHKSYLLEVKNEI